MSNNRRNNHVTQSSSEEDDTNPIQSDTEVVVFSTGSSNQLPNEDPSRNDICHVIFGDVITKWNNGTPQMLNIPRRGVRERYMRSINRLLVWCAFADKPPRNLGKVQIILNQLNHKCDEGIHRLDRDNITFVNSTSFNSLGLNLFEVGAMEEPTFNRYFRDRRSNDDKFQYLGGFFIRNDHGPDPNQFIMLVSSPNCYFWKGDGSVGRFLKTLMTAFKWEWNNKERRRRKHRRRCPLQLLRRCRRSRL